MKNPAIKIIQAKTKEDCKICDEFLSKLINYESSLDNIINPNVKVCGPAENNIKQDDVFVAYAKAEKPVGYVFGYRQFNKGKIYNTNILVLEALFVEKEFRKMGIGKMLINAFENWTKEKYGDYVIEITYINANKDAEKFYQNLGYTTVKTTLRKWLWKDLLIQLKH